MLHSHNRKLSFRLPPVRILGSMECGRSRNDCFRSSASKNNIKLKKIMRKNSAKKTVYKYRVNIGGGNRKLSMESIAVEYFPSSVVLLTTRENMNFIHI